MVVFMRFNRIYCKLQPTYQSDCPVTTFARLPDSLNGAWNHHSRITPKICPRINFSCPPD